MRVDTALLKRVARRVVELAAARHLHGLEISLVDDAAIARVNKQFLGHTGATDVISFFYPADATQAARGELLISTERAAAQSKTWGASFLREIALYIAHGVLHLNGYKDATPQQRRRMSRRQSEIVSTLAREFDLETLRRLKRRAVR
jgi:probable rRNA maturation factor